MDKAVKIYDEDIDNLFKKLNTEAMQGGYNLNPNIEFTRELLNGLLVNEKRYGYMSCPCRLASGTKNDDLDIICPCDYRDPDLAEYNACFCGLYVSERVLKKEAIIKSIPERRPDEAERKLGKTKNENSEYLKSLPLPVWRCKVCGYLCAREEPPEVCPICKARKERFERFI